MPVSAEKIRREKKIESFLTITLERNQDLRQDKWKGEYWTHLIQELRGKSSKEKEIERENSWH